MVIWTLIYPCLFFSPQLTIPSAGHGLCFLGFPTELEELHLLGVSNREFHEYQTCPIVAIWYEGTQLVDCPLLTQIQLCCLPQLCLLFRSSYQKSTSICWEGRARKKGRDYLSAFSPALRIPAGLSKHFLFHWMSELWSHLVQPLLLHHLHPLCSFCTFVF